MNRIKNLLPYIVIIIVVILMRTFIITPVKVDGSSMVPTLKNNDILLLKKYDKDYKYGDIVILKYGKANLVKRIIGVPGDSIRITNGILYINEKEIEDPYSKITNNFNLSDYGYNKIPKDYYFVMGDNRTASSDCRIIGLIKKSDILGTTNFRIFPFSSIGKVK